LKNFIEKNNEIRNVLSDEAEVDGEVTTTAIIDETANNPDFHAMAPIASSTVAKKNAKRVSFSDNISGISSNTSLNFDTTVEKENIHRTESFQDEVVKDTNNNGQCEGKLKRKIDDKVKSSDSSSKKSKTSETPNNSNSTKKSSRLNLKIFKKNDDVEGKLKRSDSTKLSPDIKMLIPIDSGLKPLTKNNSNNSSTQTQDTHNVIEKLKLDNLKLEKDCHKLRRELLEIEVKIARKTLNKMTSEEQT
jgi:hypothetical protein